MRKVTEIYFIEDNKERVGISPFSDGFVYVLEDGTKVYTMSTDTVAHSVFTPTVEA